jgi:type IX secretion system PorP/SprF family membrane protein
MTKEPKDTEMPKAECRDKSPLLLRAAAMGAFLLLAVFTEAQDLHFSQFFNSPLSTNPANTGFLPNADYRLGANYRSQWANVPVPFRTMSIYGDAQAFRNRFDNGWVGLGGLILHDKAGSGNLTSTKVYASAAYHQMLGNTGLLSAGFNLGWANKRVDVTKFTFDNQWNGKFFDAFAPSGEVFNATSISYFDMQVGLNYAWFPTDNMYLHGGISVHHINTPKETFFNASPTYDNRIARRYIFFADAVIKVSDQVILSPGAYFSTQAKATEFMAGLHANYNLTGDGEQQLIAGAYFRAGNAIIPMVGYQWKHFRFMFSYDATTSALANYTNINGALEFAVQYDGYYPTYNGDKRQSMCPSFNR